MSSGTEIIQEALQEIGAHSVSAPAHPESIVKGRNVLNSMLQMWESRGIELGTVPLDAPGDELSEPLDARNAIIWNLAILIASRFSNGKNRITPDLAAKARNSFIEVKRLYRTYEKFEKVASTTLPRGAGDRRGTRPRIFVGNDFKIGD